MITNSYLKVLLMLVIEWDLNSNGIISYGRFFSFNFHSFIESEDAGNIICGKRSNCWFHCKISIDKRLFRVRNKAKKQFLLPGLCKLQICQSPEIFKYAAALFILECLDDDDEQVVDFIHHFKLEWIDQNI